MNIGDKVRLVHGKEEGIIYAFLPGNVVEVEIEDGFRIPVLKKEIVTISPIESQRMLKEVASQKIGSQQDIIAPRVKVFAEKGIFLAFIAVNDRSLTVHLINNTDWILPFTAAATSDGKSTGLAGGALEAKSSLKIDELLMKDFESWPVFDFKFLYYRSGNNILPNGLNTRIKCRAQSFYNNKKKAPILDRDGFVYQLDLENLKKEEVSTPGSVPNQIGAGITDAIPPAKNDFPKPEPIVDLHAEKLGKEVEKLSGDLILKAQLTAFEHNLEMAIAGGMDEITFIHGSGSGALRGELHRRLSKNQHVKYFKDAQKEKFGYGATLVKIK